MRLPVWAVGHLHRCFSKMIWVWFYIICTKAVKPGPWLRSDLPWVPLFNRLLFKTRLNFMSSAFRFHHDNVSIPVVVFPDMCNYSTGKGHVKSRLLLCEYEQSTPGVCRLFCRPICSHNRTANNRTVTWFNQRGLGVFKILGHLRPMPIHAYVLQNNPINGLLHLNQGFHIKSMRTEY